MTKFGRATEKGEGRRRKMGQEWRKNEKHAQEIAEHSLLRVWIENILLPHHFFFILQVPFHRQALFADLWIVPCGWSSAVWLLVTRVFTSSAVVLDSCGTMLNSQKWAGATEDVIYILLLITLAFIIPSPSFPTQWGKVGQPSHLCYYMRQRVGFGRDCSSLGLNQESVPGWEIPSAHPDPLESHLWLLIWEPD